MKTPTLDVKSFTQFLTYDFITQALAKNWTMFLPVVVLLLIGLFIMPAFTPVITLLAIFNLAFSFLIVSKSLSISSPTELTSYPTIILISTVLRLCLSVSVTKGVLEQGEAGDFIKLIGTFSTGNSPLVGLVVFIMILVVQFIVVAKGSERVAEVAARFTLDAMPGKQMSIDADMRAGLIGQDQARRMRTSLQKESQLYGAMDGALKFIKGDSIATIILFFVNIIGGLIKGYYDYGDIWLAVEKYTVMSIGDGLVAVISSIIVALSAGFVVTRIAVEDDGSNIASDIVQQFVLDPKPLALTSGFMGVFAFLTLFAGAPALFLPLGLVGGALGGGAYFINRQRKQLEEQRADEMVKAGAAPDSDELTPTFAVPVALVVSPQLTPLIDPKTEIGARFRADLPKLRSSLYYDLGVLLPNVYVTGDAPIKEYQYMLVLKEVPMAFGAIRPDCVYVNDSAENIKVFGLAGEDVRNPADLRPGCWIPAGQRPMAELAGLKVWEPQDVMTLHLSHVLRRYTHEFIGLQEAQAYLDFAARGVPKLVEEVVPKTVSLQQFADVLQRLVQENISIRDIKTVLDALAEWGRIEKDPVMLTEYIRASMKRYLAFRHTGGKDVLFVYLLDPEIEDVIRSAIRRTSTGTFLSLDPSLTHDILAALRRELASNQGSAQTPVIITDMELRRFVRKMVELEFPSLAVLSYQELTPELNVQPIARISMRPPQNDFNYGYAPALEAETNNPALEQVN
jgi:type III secretion protein V